MTGIEPPHGLADATNSNAASALTRAAAGFGVVPKLVLADVARLDALCSVKDCPCAHEIQVRFSGCCVRSQWGRA